VETSGSSLIIIMILTMMEEREEEDATDIQFLTAEVESFYATLDRLVLFTEKVKR